MDDKEWKVKQAVFYVFNMLKFYLVTVSEGEKNFVGTTLGQGIIPILKEYVHKDIITLLTSKNEGLPPAYNKNEDQIRQQLELSIWVKLTTFLLSNRTDVERIILYILCILKENQRKTGGFVNDELFTNLKDRFKDDYFRFLKIKSFVLKEARLNNFRRVILMQKLPYILALIFISFGSIITYFINQYESNQIIGISEVQKKTSMNEVLRNKGYYNKGYQVHQDTIKLTHADNYYIRHGSNYLIDSETNDTVNSLYVSEFEFNFINITDNILRIQIDYLNDTTVGGQFIFIHDKIASKNQYLTTKDNFKDHISFSRQIDNPPSNYFKFNISLVYTNNTKPRVFFNTQDKYILTKNTLLPKLIDQRFVALIIIVFIFILLITWYFYELSRLKS